MKNRANPAAAFSRLRSANPIPSASLTEFERACPPFRVIRDSTRSADSGHDRERAPRLSTRKLGALSFAVLVAGALLALPPLGFGERLLDAFSGTPVAPKTLSDEQLQVLGAMTSGQQPRLSATEQRNVARVGAANLREIAERDGSTYYVADRTGGGLCVSIAHAGDPNPLIGWECSPDFPSAQRPILDKSVFGESRDAPVATRLEGFAADGVAAVRLVASDGTYVDAPVLDNVYSQTDGLPKAAIEKLVALSRAGAEIYTLCLTRNGCAP